MQASLFAPSPADGPLPEYYPAPESATSNRLSPCRHSPVLQLPDVPLGGVEKYPVVATTISVAEHAHSGAVTRNLPWLAELVPAAFVEISRTLAKAKGILNGDQVRVLSARGEITLRAVVTGRLRPLQTADGPIEQVTLSWQFGYEGLAKGPSANDLTPRVADPSTGEPACKAFLCDLVKVPKPPRGKR